MSDLFTVAKVDDFPPGEARVFYVRGTEIAVFNVDGNFYALDSLCPHLGGPLVAGTVEGNVVTCPWHRWQFNLETGICPVNPSFSARSYPVQIVDGKIRIKVEEGPFPLL